MGTALASLIFSIQISSRIKKPLTIFMKLVNGYKGIVLAYNCYYAYNLEMNTETLSDASVDTSSPMNRETAKAA